MWWTLSVLIQHAIHFWRYAYVIMSLSFGSLIVVSLDNLILPFVVMVFLLCIMLEMHSFTALTLFVSNQSLSLSIYLYIYIYLSVNLLSLCASFRWTKFGNFWIRKFLTSFSTSLCCHPWRCVHVLKIVRNAVEKAEGWHQKQTFSRFPSLFVVHFEYLLVK